MRIRLVVSLKPLETMNIRILFIALSSLLASCCIQTKQTSNEAAHNDSLVMNVSSNVMDSLTKVYPSYNLDFQPPSDAKLIFKLSQDYPATVDPSDPKPWKSIDFKKEPDKYLQVVLTYCLQGNLEANFEGQNNKVRKWFHTPWLHFGSNGREYIHGLTRERATPRFELHQSQDVPLENWAVGMYNAAGGFTIGQVWNADESSPSPGNAKFPEGTCTFKLLFTDGEISKVPFLKGTFEWDANIYANAGSQKKRVNRRVRLLQIDIAVKDDRATETGWVFGTFMYDASAKGKTPWEKMVPVGLSWDDDSENSSLINKPGAFLNSSLKGSYINVKLIEDSTRKYKNEAYMRHHGLGGRLNGPVDNLISSCISCHGRAGTFKRYLPFNDSSGFPMSMANFRLTRATFTVEEFKKYFSTIQGNSHALTVDNIEYVTTDYSLQLSAGIRNYFQSVRQQTAMQPAIARISKENDSSAFTTDKSFLHEELPPVTRGEN